MDVSRAYNALTVIIREIDDAIRMLKERDARLFEKIVKARKENIARACIYANEIAELRDLIKSLLAARLALEKAAERLARVLKGASLSNTADIAVVAGIIKEVASQLLYEEPLFAFELKNIAELLPIDTDEAIAIVEEAAKEAEKKLKTELPELPKLS